MTILYSHGNAEDLGLLAAYGAMMCQALKVSVCMYDYTGYGPLGGVPSAQKAVDNSRAVLNWLINERKVSSRKIILYVS